MSKCWRGLLPTTVSDLNMENKDSSLQRWLIFSYGVLAYIIGLTGQIWFILYISDWDILERSIHSPQSVSTWEALAINLFLVLLFGLQHSVMARPWFKKKMTKIIPVPAERSTYVLLSGIVFILISLYWQPIDGYVWHVENSALAYLLMGGFVLGWFFSVVASFVINHFELFGLQQVYLHLKNRPVADIAFQEKLFYRFVRHPIQLGVLVGLWSTSLMTYGHFLLSVLFTLYIFIGLYYEEIDMQKEFGEVYMAYKKRVGMLFPRKIKK